MTNFGGWVMPLQYSPTREGAPAVRGAVGLFDLSHMGELRVADESLAQRVITRDVARLKPGRIQYALRCDKDGGVIDDVLVYAMPDASYWLVVNAGNQDGDFEWILSQSSVSSPARGGGQGGGSVLNVGREWALIGVQGPRAVGLVQRLTRAELGSVKYYAFVEGTVADVPCVISRTGYTGEDAFELFCANAAAGVLCRALPVGGRPGGPGRRRSMRASPAASGQPAWVLATPCDWKRECASTATTWTATPIRSKRGWIGPSTSTRTSSAATPSSRPASMGSPGCSWDSKCWTAAFPVTATASSVMASASVR